MIDRDKSGYELIVRVHPFSPVFTEFGNTADNYHSDSEIAEHYASVLKIPTDEVLVTDSHDNQGLRAVYIKKNR